MAGSEGFEGFEGFAYGGIEGFEGFEGFAYGGILRIGSAESGSTAFKRVAKKFFKRVETQVFGLNASECSICDTRKNVFKRVGPKGYVLQVRRV